MEVQRRLARRLHNGTSTAQRRAAATTLAGLGGRLRALVAAAVARSPNN